MPGRTTCRQVTLRIYDCQEDIIRELSTVSMPRTPLLQILSSDILRKPEPSRTHAKTEAKTEWLYFQKVIHQKTPRWSVSATIWRDKYVKTDKDGKFNSRRYSKPNHCSESVAIHGLQRAGGTENISLLWQLENTDWRAVRMQFRFQSCPPRPSFWRKKEILSTRSRTGQNSSYLSKLLMLFYKTPGVDRCTMHSHCSGHFMYGILKSVLADVWSNANATKHFPTVPPRFEGGFVLCAGGHINKIEFMVILSYQDDSRSMQNRLSPSNIIGHSDQDQNSIGRWRRSQRETRRINASLITIIDTLWLRERTPASLRYNADFCANRVLHGVRQQK